MTPILAIPAFLASLVVTLAAARLFARRLDHLGIRFGFPEALIGLLAALAADGPEISSALFALTKGADNVSVGVLVGSNAFNLAAMIGITGLLAGSVRLQREALLLEGFVVGAITVIAAAVLLRWVDATVAAAVAVLLLVPYLLIVIGGGELLAHHRYLGRLTAPLARTLDQHARTPRQRISSSDPTHHLLALILLDVTLIVAGSVGMVQSALALGDRWHLSRAVLGVLVLAPLTSLPNALTGIRLGLAGRGAALVGETFNSNTINLGVGVIIPALFVSLAALSSSVTVQLFWLILMTGLTLLALARPRGIGRWEAAVLTLLYLGFAAIQLI